MSQALRKKTYSSLVSLCLHHEWLREYEAPLLELVSSCGSPEEVSLLCDLLQRFTYLTSGDRSPLWEGMARQIVQEWGLDEKKTQIVATTHQPDEADSAQWVLQLLKAKLRSAGWRRPTLINRIGSSLSRVGERPFVVFVDEFMGTGTTMRKRIRDYKPQYLRKANNVEIRVCVLASMEQALEVVKNEAIEIHAELVLRKGISDYYTGVDLGTARDRMLRLESELDPDAGMEDFHSFGHGQAESLYATDEGNATNCMFPVFWWEYLRHNRTRPPMFYRAENVRR